MGTERGTHRGKTLTPLPGGSCILDGACGIGCLPDVLCGVIQDTNHADTKRDRWVPLIINYTIQLSFIERGNPPGSHGVHGVQVFTQETFRSEEHTSELQSRGHIV